MISIHPKILRPLIVLKIMTNKVEKRLIFFFLKRLSLVNLTSTYITRIQFLLNFRKDTNDFNTSNKYLDR